MTLFPYSCSRLFHLARGGYLCLIILCLSPVHTHAFSPAKSIPLVCLADIHFTPFQDPKIFSDLASSPAEKWADIFQRSLLSTPSSWGEETNASLLQRMLQTMRQKVSSPGVVFFHGDFLAHHFHQKFVSLSDDDSPQALQAFIRKTIRFVASQIRDSLPRNVPVLFVLGNNDAYAGNYQVVCGGKFLNQTADFLHHILLAGDKSSFPGFAASYRRLGAYSFDLPTSSITCLCLNSVLFSRKRPDTPNNRLMAEEHLDWLQTRLDAAASEGRRVWLLMHVPPGVDTYATISSCTGQRGKLTGAVMMWRPGYQQRFLDIVQTYPQTVTAGFAGHTHMDSFRFLTRKKGKVALPVFLGPSISPIFGNNPAVQVFSLSRESRQILDRRSWVLPLEVNKSSSGELSGYLFSRTYVRHSPLIPAVTALYPQLGTQLKLKKKYLHWYDSGSPHQNIASGKATWPAYWCAIGNPDQTRFMSCVHKYTSQEPGKGQKTEGR